MLQTDLSNIPALTMFSLELTTNRGSLHTAFFVQYPGSIRLNPHEYSPRLMAPVYRPRMLVAGSRSDLLSTGNEPVLGSPNNPQEMVSAFYVAVTQRVLTFTYTSASYVLSIVRPSRWT